MAVTQILGMTIGRYQDSIISCKLIEIRSDSECQIFFPVTSTRRPTTTTTDSRQPHDIAVTVDMKIILSTIACSLFVIVLLLIVMVVRRRASYVIDEQMPLLPIIRNSTDVETVDFNVINARSNSVV